MTSRMRVAAILVTYSAFPGELIDSLRATRHEVQWEVFHHGPDKALGRRIGLRIAEVGGIFHPHGTNRGLARSWNEGIRAGRERGADLILLLNDDLFFYENGFDRFVDFAAEAARDPTAGLITVKGLETGGPTPGIVQAQNFACCVLTDQVLDAVGYLDENFRPAYFEDIDYHRRLQLAGFREVWDERVLVEHARGQTTLANPGLSEAYRANLDYWLRKWGQWGEEGERTYAHPFDDARFGLRIPYEKRAAPYGPPFDRLDVAPRFSARSLLRGRRPWRREG